MAPPPGDGNVTFLFTDIEGSTRLWETHTEAMRVALARHDVLVRDAIEMHSGRVFKELGDAFCAAFARPDDAVRAALAVQQSLRPGDTDFAPQDGLVLRVRVALHIGAAEARGGDYFGASLSRVDRLLEIGHGGQTLLSDAVRATLLDETAGSATPPVFRLLDLGRHRLRDLQTPEHVWQLCPPDTNSDGDDEFPPLRSPDAAPFLSLPPTLTPLIGRDEERTEIARRLAVCRLLTLTGPGGTGKTRLAIQAAHDRFARGAGGACFVDLAPLTDPGLVARAVASALRLAPEPGRALLETLAEQIGSWPHPLLLVFDNCEHLIETCARLADTLLRACPDLRILATSREGLDVPGEQAWPVPSLPVPLGNAGRDAQNALGYAAVRLFAERAGAARPGFVLSDANAAVVARICRRLDGIPLAIELAAAWAGVLSEAEIERRLDDRFRFLTRGPRTVLPHQQTLQALIDWSHDLLAPAERALLRRLSVFAGGFTLETVEAVCAWDDDPLLLPDDVLDAFSRLVAKSLVPTGNDVTNAPAGRYRLLETIREYAAARLRSDAPAGEEATLRERHRAHFLALAEQAEPHLQGPDQAAWLDRLEAEHDNLRAALAPQGDGSDVPLRLCGALYWFWMVRGHLGEDRERLRQALSAAPPMVSGEPADIARAKALKGAGILSTSVGDFAAATGHLSESLVLYKKRGQQKDIASVLNNLAIVASNEANYALARSFYEEALGMYRRMNDEARVAQVLSNLGSVAMQQGEYDIAHGFLSESLVQQERRGDTFSVASTLLNLGVVAYYQGRLSESARLLEDSLRIGQEIGEKSLLPLKLFHLARIQLAQGDFSSATRLFAAVEAACRNLGIPLSPNNAAEYEHDVAAIRQSENASDFARAWAEGQAMALSGGTN